MLMLNYLTSQWGISIFMCWMVENGCSSLGCVCLHHMSMFNKCNSCNIVADVGFLILSMYYDVRWSPTKYNNNVIYNLL